jgi:hypothetical protein
VPPQYRYEYSDDPIEASPASGSKFQILFFIALLIVAALTLRSVYAANISLNLGSQTEFGQGLTTTVACSGSDVITVNPQSSFVNATNAGSFFFSGFAVRGIPSGCVGKNLTFSFYSDTSTAALPIFASTASSLTVLPTGSSFTTSNSGVTLSQLTGNSFTATFDSPVQRSTNISKLTAESSQNETYRDLGSIAFAASDSLTVSSMTALGTGAYTAEMWIKMTSSPTGDALMLSGSGALGLYINSTRDQIKIVKWADGTGTQIFYVSALSLNTWHHIAVVRDSSARAQLFLNGSKSANPFITDSNNYSGAISSVFGSGTGSKLIGRLSNLRITNTAVYDPTATTITQPTSPLSAVSGTLLLLNTKTSSPYLDSSPSARTVTASGSPSTSTDNPFN